MKLNPPTPGSFTARRCSSGVGTGKHPIFLSRNDYTSNTAKTGTPSSTVPGIPDTPAPSFINTATFLHEFVSNFTRAPFIAISLSTCVATASRVAPNRHSAADSSSNAGPRWLMRRRAASPSCTGATATRGTLYQNYDHVALRISEVVIDSSLYITRTHHRPSETIVLLVPLPGRRFGAYYSSRKNASGAAFTSSN